MAGIFAYTCSCCDQVHEGSPSFGYKTPYYYASLSEEEQRTIARCSGDLCTIERPEGNEYFIRCVLEIPIHGVEEPFTWGVWASLSEKSFKRYEETYDDPQDGDVFFGWFANGLPFYPQTLSLPSDVVVRPGGKRPYIRLHGDRDHPLVHDQRDGISIARAQEIAEAVMHPA